VTETWKGLTARSKHDEHTACSPRAHVGNQSIGKRAHSVAHALQFHSPSPQVRDCPSPYCCECCQPLLVCTLTAPLATQP
jgi:hypothetical protein